MNQQMAQQLVLMMREDAEKAALTLELFRAVQAIAAGEAHLVKNMPPPAA